MRDYTVSVVPFSYGRESNDGILAIIFMDHMMPSIDGIATTLELRKLGGCWRCAHHCFNGKRDCRGPGDICQKWLERLSCKAYRSLVI